MAEYIHKQLYGVSAADCVLSVSQILGESLLIVFFNEMHALVIHVFDVLPDLSLAIKWLEIKVFSPVAKITRYYKHSVLVIEIRR